ncbi:SNARE associated Golgi protein, putative [Trypanosoma equiperdum]|uniref:VTT domain-containing protein n=2 Tax=Trypanozoon TaxID=39700 RepID=Q4GYC8_TRYB2|nr:hypothetical protein, conserved [Trypanosoma brucei brucei TREU927]CAJ16656.1 hypothetical protein, conserved [Trypanosoma brucei brucei TREU927]SCU65530.1 SNARE associated Golgi protein, putative [Trypanosoma equiperdum]
MKGAVPSTWASLASVWKKTVGEFELSTLLMAQAVAMLALYKVTNGFQMPFRSLFFFILVIYVILLALHLVGAVPLLFEVYDIIVRNYTSTQEGDSMIHLCRDLHELAETERARVMFVLTLVYVFLQSFCLPGSALINAAIGAVIGLPLGVPYCVLMGTAGASSCYTISHIIAGRCNGHNNRLVQKLRKQVEERTPSDLFAYFLLLRLTPVVPNWLLNMASPVAGVPLPTYAAGTLIGIIPQTYISVRFGEAALTTLSGEELMMTPWDMMWIGILCIVVFAGCMLKRRYGKVDCNT